MNKQYHILEVIKLHLLPNNNFSGHYLKSFGHWLKFLGQILDKFQPTFSCHSLWLKIFSHLVWQLIKFCKHSSNFVGHWLKCFGQQQKIIIVGLMTIIDWMFKIFQATRNFVFRWTEKIWLSTVTTENFQSPNSRKLKIWLLILWWSNLFLFANSTMNESVFDCST